jgi:hypothetical protein
MMASVMASVMTMTTVIATVLNAYPATAISVPTMIAPMKSVLATTSVPNR